jgi:hypothetical protein
MRNARLCSKEINYRLLVFVLLVFDELEPLLPEIEPVPTALGALEELPLLEAPLEDAFEEFVPVVSFEFDVDFQLSLPVWPVGTIDCSSCCAICR